MVSFALSAAKHLACLRIVFVNKKVLQKGVKKVSTFNTQ